MAAGAVIVGSIYHITFSYYSMNAFSILLWAVCFWILVEIERRDEPRLWILFGALTGLALENKHTFVLLLVGLAAGMVLTHARRHFRSRWLWIGCAIAALLILPNLIWQTIHGWPSIEFYRNADIYKNVPTPPTEVLTQQILTMNPGALPVWLAGLVFFLTTARGRPFRHLGWIYLVLLVLMLIGQKSRPDRIADVYIVLFAGGGALLTDLCRRLAPSYGQAGAIELLGRGRDLPRVYSSQNSYSHWGPPNDPVDAAIVMGPFGEETVRWLFDEVKLVRVHDCDWCMTWRDKMPIWLARGQKVLFADAWLRLKHYE
jgi:4-amino-4-deoxy-L-arabinose transferase-like glycosyltransferase